MLDDTTLEMVAGSKKENLRRRLLRSPFDSFGYVPAKLLLSIRLAIRQSLLTQLSLSVLYSFLALYCLVPAILIWVYSR